MQVDQRSFPVCIDDPSSRNGGSAYVADLAAEGPRLGLRVFEGAICTIARECADASLERVELFDYCTALATDATGVSHHIELFYDDEPLDVTELGILHMLRRPDADRIALVTVGRNALGGVSAPGQRGYAAADRRRPPNANRALAPAVGPTGRRPRAAWRPAEPGE